MEKMAYTYYFTTGAKLQNKNAFSWRFVYSLKTYQWFIFVAIDSIIHNTLTSTLAEFHVKCI